MKKFLIPAIALAAASVAVPAMAQNYGHQDRGSRYEQDHRGDRYDRDRHNDRGDHYGWDRRYDRYGHNEDRNWQPIAQRRNQVQRLIDRGLRNGWLSRREARYVHTELQTLVRLEYRYQHDGLSRRERQDLQYRYDRLIALTRQHRNDHDGYTH